MRSLAIAAFLCAAAPAFAAEALLARIGRAVGVLGLVGAAHFWVAGDDLHKYDSFKEAEVSAALSDGGAALALAGRF